MKTKFFLYGLGMTALITACKSGTDSEKETKKEIPAWAKEISCSNNWEKFANDHFSICFPADWKLEDGKSFGAEFIIKHVDAGSEERAALFSRNINVIKQDPKNFEAMGIKDFDAYAKYSREQIDIQMKNPKVFAFVNIELNGIQAYKNIMEAELNGRMYHFEQMIFPHNESYYVITFTCNKDESVENKRLGSEIIQTLRLNQ